MSAFALKSPSTMDSVKNRRLFQCDILPSKTVVKKKTSQKKSKCESSQGNCPGDVSLENKAAKKAEEEAVKARETTGEEISFGQLRRRRSSYTLYRKPTLHTSRSMTNLNSNCFSEKFVPIIHVGTMTVQPATKRPQLSKAFNSMHELHLKSATAVTPTLSATPTQV